jgi:hypothetical protein
VEETKDEASSDSDDSDTKESADKSEESAEESGKASGSTKVKEQGKAEVVKKEAKEEVVPSKGGKKVKGKGKGQCSAMIVQKVLNKLIQVSHECAKTGNLLSGKYDVARRSEMHRLQGLAEQACHAGLQMTTESDEHILEWSVNMTLLITAASTQLKQAKKLVGSGAK